MDRPVSRPDRLKIVVFGPYHAGKSSFIRSIDPEARQTEARTRRGDHTTIAIDFGRTTVGKCQVYLFGTPGQGRFEFVRTLIMQGLDGALLLVDGTRGLHAMHEEIQETLRRKGIPVAYLINTFSRSSDTQMIRSRLRDASIHEISALDPVSSRAALESFVRDITRASWDRR